MPPEVYQFVEPCPRPTRTRPRVELPRHAEPRAPRAGRVSAVRRASPGFRCLLLLVFAAFLAVGVAGAVAQSSGATLRLAFLPEWVLEQHRGMGGAARPEFRAALDRGVVDRVVFWWQPGIVQRPVLVAKPVRVLAGTEALALGGRGEFRLAALRLPAGASAWTEVEVAAESARPEDALVLEVGGELGAIRRVLETLRVRRLDHVNEPEPGLGVVSHLEGFLDRERGGLAAVGRHQDSRVHRGSPLRSRVSSPAPTLPKRPAANTWIS